MTSDQPSPRRIAVIGGGIAGLAAAHRLRELDPRCELTLFEAGPRLGGVLSTVCEEGFQVEQSADNFITTIPWGIDLCRRLGLADELVQTNAAYRRTFVVHRGRLHRLPDGFLMMAPTQWWPLAVSPILSPLGKLRAALEYFIPPREGDADESMAGFRPPPPGPRNLRPARRAPGQRGLRRRPGETQRAGHAAAFSGDGTRFWQPDPRHAASTRPPQKGGERRPLQHVCHAPRRVIEPGRRRSRAAAPRRGSPQHAGCADRAPQRSMACLGPTK